MLSIRRSQLDHLGDLYVTSYGRFQRPHISENTVTYRVFGFVDLGNHLLFFYGVPEAREIFKNLPGVHGVVVVQYEPMASHGDHIRARNY